jgi:hypothetical protein
MNRRESPSIWWWAFGYFAAYAPYAALTKVVTSIGIDGQKVDGVQLRPVTLIATVLTAATFLIATGWWRAAVKPGGRLPTPTILTAVSGLCASGIIATTTLAYTFKGVSIVFVMLLMRGGLLILAPLIDVIGRRRIRWYSAVALVLSVAALASSMIDVTFGGDALLSVRFAKAKISLACGIDVAIYLFCYFVRLQLMTKRAKSSDGDANLRYFVEEQLVSAPAMLLGLAIWAFAAPGAFAGSLHAGFTSFWDSSLVPWALAIGILSQGTGIFGGLILLDKSENTFSIPVNRASSVLAGVVGSFAIWLILDAAMPKTPELIGAGIMIAAIAILSVGSIRDRQKRVVSPAKNELRSA